MENGNWELVTSVNVNLFDACHTENFQQLFMCEFEF